MKKILTSIMLLFLGIFLCIPVLLSIFSHHMDMTESLCVEHCLDAGTFSNTDISFSHFVFQEFLVLKIVFERVFKEVFLVSPLLFFFLIFAPPNRKRSIKNYDYISLIGIVKLSN